MSRVHLHNIKFFAYLQCIFIVRYLSHKQWILTYCNLGNLYKYTRKVSINFVNYRIMTNYGANVLPLDSADYLEMVIHTPSTRPGAVLVEL